MAENNREKNYVLVHGSCHGAFCWEEVIAHLEKRGKKRTRSTSRATERGSPNVPTCVMTITPTPSWSSSRDTT